MTPLHLHGAVVSFGDLKLGPFNHTLGPGVHHLIGANGTGKSTWMRLAVGELKPHKGAVRVFGQDPFMEASARAHVALAPTEPQLPGALTVHQAWTGLAAIRGCPGWRGERWCEAFKLPFHVPLQHCSAGQRHKAEIIASAVGDPNIWLLDEPFTALDVASVEVLVKWLESSRHRTIVVTHHGELPLRADYVIDLSAPMR